MKIYLKDDEGHLIFLPIPNGLLLNRFILKLINEKCGFDLSIEKARELKKTLRRMKKIHRNLYLVDIKGDDGERVKISL